MEGGGGQAAAGAAPSRRLLTAHIPHHVASIVPNTPHPYPPSHPANRPTHIHTTPARLPAGPHLRRPCRYTQAMTVGKGKVAVPLSSCPGRCSERGGCVARTLRGGQQLPGACSCFKGYQGESCEDVVEGLWANNCYNNCSGGWWLWWLWCSGPCVKWASFNQPSRVKDSDWSWSARLQRRSIWLWHTHSGLSYDAAQAPVPGVLPLSI